MDTAKENKKTKKQRKKFNLKFAVASFNGSKRYILFALIALLLQILLSYVSPLITGYTVDYIVGSTKVPDPLIQSAIDMLGGRMFLREHLYICGLLVIGCMCLTGLFIFLRGSAVSKATENFAKNMRDRLYTHLQKLPYDYHKHVSTGDLVQRCTSDVDTVRRFVSTQLLDIFRCVCMATVACVIMFSMNARMAAYSTCLLPVILISSFVYFRLVRKQFTISDEAEGKLSATLQENLTGLRVVRAFAQQRSEVDSFTECNKNFRDETYKLNKLMGIYWGAGDMLGYGQILLTAVMGIITTVTTDDFTLGDFLVFTSYSGMITWPMRRLGRVLADLGKATVSYDRLEEILTAPVEEEPGKALSPTIKGDIEFKHVCFGYDAPDDVLSDISFSVKHGQTIAILGSTGSGKSSLVQLLQRLYTATRGEILIDGVNINDIEHGHLRKNIGIVLQEPFLYSRSIMENIKITNPDVTDETVFEAARVAAVHNVITEFEDGYNTMVGEKGVTLSGGQKQRVAIARMLIQKAPIIIFDDSLSAVDTETDTAIRAALKTRRENTTTFIISHRITTLCEADKILVLDHGKLVDEGTHEELISREGLYRRVANIQNALEEEFNLNN